MAERMTGGARGSPAQASPASWAAAVEQLDEAECLALIATAEIGRLAYSGTYGPVVLPVAYRLLEGTIVFPTSQWSTVDEDLRTGIERGPEGEREQFLRVIPISIVGRRAHHR